MGDSASPPTMKAVRGEDWRVELPESLIAHDHTGWGYEGGVLARGWIGEAPVTAVVQRRTLDRGFREWTRLISRTWLEKAHRRCEVPGAQDAVRIDGVVEFDGLGARDDRENCTTVLAKRGRKVWSVTVRSRPEDGIGALLEPIFTSFALEPQSSKPESSTSASP